MRLRSLLLGLALPFALAGLGDRAEATTIFSETFDGYTSFPDEDPAGDPVNPGRPLVKEGADELWYGARFGVPETECRSCKDKRPGWGKGPGKGYEGPKGKPKVHNNIVLDCDLAVQQVGGSGNTTPVGRFDDQAGLLFAVDTTGLSDVLLSFDWRTFLAPSSDESVVGYFVGRSPFDVNDCKGKDCKGKKSGGILDPALFVELARVGGHTDFTHNQFALPENVGTVWVAFWHDGGENHFTKIDNVLVTGDKVPEPSAMFLLLAGTAGLAAFGRRKR